MRKFDNLIHRLIQKVEMSATPVTGFMVGVSGTDSLVTFILLSEVAKAKGFKVTGLHYMDENVVENTVTRTVFSWLLDRYPDSSLLALNLPVGNHDQFRWGDIHYRAAEARHWVASTVNATEKALGTYSILTKSASISPIASLYKSEVLQVCSEYGVPDEVIARSRLPDCICGRDEFAAENIELIDEVLRNSLTKDYPTALVRNAMDYIRDKRAENGFKDRTPYTV